ncbi:MAG: hypothetical protein SF052_05705 [Bacteroidia bacterium]|nr:hypothetical protein [Bacteroidia bacterium]
MRGNITKLSSLQLELLRIYSFNPTEEELSEIKKFLGKFFARRLSKSVEEAVTAKGIQESDLETWLNEENQ